MLEVDRDGAGQIQNYLSAWKSLYERLRVHMIELQARIGQRDPVEEILEAFKLLDVDSRGKISWKNLRKVLGENVSDNEVEAMIDEFDKDGDGEINENEVLGIMKQTSIY